MADVTMPQLGETVTEGTITRWFKQVGDRVEADEPLFEVSTDKVDTEVPAPMSGWLTEILVPEGETVEVGARLAVISETPPAGGEEPAAPGGDRSAAPATASAAPDSAPPGEEAPGTAAPPPPTPATGPSPEEPAVAAGDDGEGGPSPGPGGPPLLSPVVRRLIREHNLDPAQITGTGAGGRITRDDVLRHIDQLRAGQAAPSGAEPRQAAPGSPSASAPPVPAAPPPTAPASEPSPAPPPAVPAEGGTGEAPRGPAPAPARHAGTDEIVPFSNIRRRTAEHMVRSKATSPHVLTAVEVDYEAVERVRRSHRERFRAEEGFGLTYLPFVVRAVVDALAEFPRINASVDGDNLVIHHEVNIGIAVDLDFEGLLVPVIRGADGLRLRAIARAIVDLAERARSKRLSPDDLAGGTFTITNPGPFGTAISAPIINQPQVAILSTEGVHRQPVVVGTADGGEALAIHSVGYLCMSWDHRAFDGAYAAAFLRRLKEIIETRDWEAEL